VSKTGTIGTLVKVYPDGRKFPALIVRVQDHLSIQFTYSKPDDDNVTGIFRNDGEWHDDFETEDVWAERAPTNSESESGCKDSDRNEMVDRPWLQPGRRRRKVQDRTV